MMVKSVSFYKSIYFSACVRLRIYTNTDTTVRVLGVLCSFIQLFFLSLFVTFKFRCKFATLGLERNFRSLVFIDHRLV